jgi:PAS domain S-box-containing protein
LVLQGGLDIFDRKNDQFTHYTSANGLPSDTIYGILQDEQVQRMTQIRQVQAERDRILEVSPDMICILGMDGYFKYLNPAWEKNSGYTDEALMSGKFLDFVHPDDRAKTLREIESLAAGRRTVDFENRYTHKDGSIRHLSWMATPLTDEKRIYAVARDITKRKQVERALRESEEKFRTLVTNTEEIVYMVDKNGTFLLSEGKGLAKLSPGVRGFGPGYCG